MIWLEHFISYFWDVLMNNTLQYRSVSILLLMVVECILTYLIVHYLLIIQQSYLINLSLSYMPTYLPLSTFDNLFETVYFIDRLYGGFIYFYFHFVGFSLLKIFTKKFHCIYFFFIMGACWVDEWIHATTCRWRSEDNLHQHCRDLESNSDSQDWWQPHLPTELSYWFSPPFTFVRLVLH